jgi:hypothetical protein
MFARLGCADQAWLTKTRAKLASFLNASALDLAFVENASGGMNALLRSLNLKQGDAVCGPRRQSGIFAPMIFPAVKVQL